MLKKKLSAKSPKSAKPAKQAKLVTENYLSPLHEVTQCIENDYIQLKKLLETIPAKIEKSIAATKVKLKKSKEAQIKSEKLLADTKKKQKTKSSAKNKQDLAKVEKCLSEIKAATAAIDAEFKQLSEQLQTCKKMKNEHAALEKILKKTKSKFGKNVTKKPKRILKNKNSKNKLIDNNKKEILPVQGELEKIDV